MKNLIFVFVIMLSLSSCAVINYTSDHLEKDSTVASFQTYNIEGECERGVNRVLETRVTNSLNNFMGSRGYKKSDNPDRLIQFFIKEENKNYLSYECDYYRRWDQGEQCSARVVNYKEGSIVIDIVDVGNSKIIWHGAMSGPSFKNMKDPDEKISTYVENLMDKFLMEKS